MVVVLSIETRGLADQRGPTTSVGDPGGSCFRPWSEEQPSIPAVSSPAMAAGGPSAVVSTVVHVPVQSRQM
jgi:hypothetical protein